MKRGTDQDDGQHGDVVDHLHDAAEPRAGQVGVEAGTRLVSVIGVALPSRAVQSGIRHLAEGDALDVGGADEGLADMMVASMLSWMSGCLPASTSRWKSGGMVSVKL
jgi:hypothetical protein